MKTVGAAVFVLVAFDGFGVLEEQTVMKTVNAGTTRAIVGAIVGAGVPPVQLEVASIVLSVIMDMDEEAEALVVGIVDEGAVVFSTVFAEALAVELKEALEVVVEVVLDMARVVVLRPVVTSMPTASQN